MLVELIAFGLIRAEAALTGACVLVLLLRGTVRDRYGADPAYRLWALVPLAGLASVFPSLSSWPGQGAGGSLGLQHWAEEAFQAEHAEVLLVGWAAGAGGFLMLVLVGESRFRRSARRGLVGPAVVGVVSPRVFLPVDFQTRFTGEEQDLIRAHERAHIERGDPAANLLVMALQVFAWFNPLAHVASACFRVDQELACDARVTEWRPQVVRAYAHALVKAQQGAAGAPLGCGLAGPPGRHPLELRIAMLRRGGRSERRRATGLLLTSGMASAATLAVLFLAPHSPLLHAQ